MKPRIYITVSHENSKGHQRSLFFFQVERAEPADAKAFAKKLREAFKYLGGKANDFAEECDS